MKARAQQVLGELGAVLNRQDWAQVERACEMIAGAGRVVLYGCGREGLQMRGLAMRLFHLGLRVAMQGDMTTPPVGPGDLFMASAGPGELATVTALMRVAREAGAAVLLLTGEPETESAALATEVLTIPAQTMASDTGEGARSILPMGSAYEGAMFVLFEVMVLELREILGVSAEQMRARHTNLE